MKPIDYSNNKPGTIAPAGSSVRSVTPLDLIRRMLPKLTDEELRRLHYDIDAQLRSRAEVARR